MLPWVIKATLLLICWQKTYSSLASHKQLHSYFSVRTFPVQHVYPENEVSKISLKEELTYMTPFEDNFRSVKRIKKCSRCYRNSHLRSQTSRRFLQAAEPCLNQFVLWFLSVEILCFPRSSKSLLRLLLLLHQKKRAIQHERIERRKT